MGRRKVLIVDDDKEIVDLIELYLAGESYDILKAYDGQECFSILQKEIISLLALDIMMPKIDGLAVFRQVRKKSNIPIFIIILYPHQVVKSAIYRPLVLWKV